MLSFKDSLKFKNVLRVNMPRVTQDQFSDFRGDCYGIGSLFNFYLFQLSQYYDHQLILKSIEIHVCSSVFQMRQFIFFFLYANYLIVCM